MNTSQVGALGAGPGRSDGILWKVDLGSWKHADMRWIAWIAISIAFHAVVLSWMTPGIRSDGFPSLSGHLDVRLVSPQSAREAVTVQPQPTLIERAPQTIQKPIRSVSSASRLSSLPAKFDESQYLPSARLSVRPSPVGNIAVPYPDDVTQQGITTTALTLFIDEDGTVARVHVDDPRLPPSFADAALQAFMQGRFLPGRLDDAPVKSRMRVEVTFENRATPR